jgi:hypothetical protein
MRETALGFFDKYLRGVGAGAPVPEPAFSTERPDAPEMYVLPDPPAKTLTMRGIAEATFGPSGPGAAERGNGSIADFITLNGGLPAAVPAEVTEIGRAAGRRRVTFVSEPGLTLPAIVWPAQGQPRAVAVLVSDQGKVRAGEEFSIAALQRAGVTCVAFDPRGLGETAGLDLRLQTYLGQAPAFGMGWDIARAIAALAPDGARVAVVGRGAVAGEAALVAALVEPRIGFVAGLATLREFSDGFGEDVPLLAIQPRANYAPSLSRLRALVGATSVWSFRGEPEAGWTAALIRWAAQ